MRQSQTNTAPCSRRSLRLIIALVSGLLIVGDVLPASAASSWNPTLLVNTESFSTIDDGDSTTDIELRFGGSLNEKLFYDRSETRFQLTRGLYIQGNLTATGSLSVSGATVLDGATTIGNTLDTTGAITTDSDLTINHDNGAADAVLTFGNDAGAETLKFSDSTNQFEFSDDVKLTGDLTVTGGVQMGNYAPGTGTGAGTIRWTGTDYEGYDGTGWKTFTAAGKFVGTTVSTSDGSVGTGSLVGYQAANEICVHAFTGSHMCQVDEIISTVGQNLSSFSGMVNGWASMGAPGYTADANDCAGWTSGDGGDLGSWWEFSTDGGVTIESGGGKGYLTNCAVAQPIACCR
ncbi:MAG: hypothetical protein PHO20_01495 [Candidatus Peribacteraceae bacterium]|nr:hypothetical protein [Candidatus Peribacteraceae bacterium]MDD5739423.1 hypothetical protein [Candidatus Peribacteraceae bacterium]